MSKKIYGDIRTVTPEEHWKHFEKTWQALEAYTYLGKKSPYLDVGVERETMPLRHDMRNSLGGIMAAPLCIAAPEAYWRDDECVPAPVTMSYDILDPAYDVKSIEVIREVLQIGRQMGFSRSRIVDENDHSRVIAMSSGSGFSLGDVPPGFYPVDNPVNDTPDSPDLPPLRDVFGVLPGPNGTVEIAEVTAEIASPHSALHQGPINIAMEAAAMDELERVTGSHAFQVEQWKVMFIKPGYDGPFRATAKLLNVNGVRVGAEITMTDEGHNGRIIASASAAFRRMDR